MEIFTKDEIRDITISVLALIIIFSWMPFPSFGLDLNRVPYLVIGVVIAFLLHELAHKFMARKLGMAAFFKMWPQGILIGLVFMIMGFKLVAPGAVVVHPYKFGRWGYRRSKPEAATGEMGIISVVGPATNIILAIFFSFFNGALFHQLTFINAWLAMINLLPIPPLDGSKVLIWKPWIWMFCISLAVILVFIG